MKIFDHRVLDTHLRRAAMQPADPFLWRHLGWALQDRLLDIKRDFSDVAEIGPAPFVFMPEFAQRKQPSSLTLFPPVPGAEEIWPLTHHSLDAVISLGHLHWANDLPGTLIQFKNALRPDGLFLAAFIGGESLRELRSSIAQIEMEIYGGISPRVSPFVTLPDMAALMQRGGFSLPVVDNEFLTVTYSGLDKMIADLRGMGQSHAVIKRDRKILCRHFWPRVEEFYRAQFSENGRLLVTIEIIYALGWAPDASQPQPLKRGSATHQLVDVLKQHEK